MKNLLNAFPLASFIVGTDGYVTGANGKAFSLFGKDIIGRTSVEVVRNPNVSDAIEEALKQKIQRHCDWSTTQATTDIVYHVTASWIEADEILVTFQDITDIEQSLRARREFVTNAFDRDAWFFGNFATYGDIRTRSAAAVSRHDAARNSKDEPSGERFVIAQFRARK
jgi:PAS domain-containing protein